MQILVQSNTIVNFILYNLTRNVFILQMIIPILFQQPLRLTFIDLYIYGRTSSLIVFCIIILENAFNFIHIQILRYLRLKEIMEF